MQRLKSAMMQLKTLLLKQSPWLKHFVCLALLLSLLHCYISQTRVQRSALSLRQSRIRLMEQTREDSTLYKHPDRETVTGNRRSNLKVLIHYSDNDSNKISAGIPDHNSDPKEKIFTPPPGERRRRRFPNAIIIGTGKCGTRALLEFLRLHPYIEATTSEVHFFDKDVNFDRGFGWYRSLMPESYSNQITLEKTPSYVENERAALGISKLDKDRKINLIWVVKDPVVRLMSVVAKVGINSPHFYLTKTNGSLTIKADNNAVCRGKYAVHIKKWLDHFPLAQLHVIDGSNLVRDPLTHAKAVEKFLEIPPLLTKENFYFNSSRGFYCPVPFNSKVPHCLGKNKGRTHPKLNSTVRRLLYDFYRPYNEQFFKILGQTFDWKNKGQV